MFILPKRHCSSFKYTYAYPYFEQSLVERSTLEEQLPMKSLSSVCPSVCPSVRLSLKLLKIGSLVFSGVVHNDI